MEALRFEGLAGNSGVKRQIAAFIDAGQFPHALLIEGAPGSGRRSFARFIAKAAVCTADGRKPCGVCAACRKAAGGYHPDIDEYGGDDTARSFHVDTVRSLRDGAYMRPNEAERRVILLCNAHTMTEQAQNALLRILEEPPRHLLFLLTCENRTQMLTTIQSRVQCLTLSGVDETEALPLLTARLPQADPQELRRALSVFDGSIGQVIDAMEGETFPRVLETVSALARALLTQNELSLLVQAAPLDRDRKLTEGVLNGLLLVFRDALCAGRGQSSRLSTAPEIAEQLARTYTAAQLMRLSDAVRSLQKASAFNMSSPLLLTLLSARFSAAVGR